ncbi:hypothetical protein KC353_g59 [Hortaea werneckii]|nr:hypothetical protein KC353_g59 [Hortaea werneckii]
MSPSVDRSTLQHESRRARLRNRIASSSQETIPILSIETHQGLFPCNQSRKPPSGCSYESIYGILFGLRFILTLLNESRERMFPPAARHCDAWKFCWQSRVSTPYLLNIGGFTEMPESVLSWGDISLRGSHTSDKSHETEL